jgi:hypothetical protein
MSNPFGQFDLNNFNSFIQSASQQIACGTECQQQKQANQLKTNYQNAESNLQLARPQYDIAKKEYYTYVDGQSGYNQMMEQEYTNDSEIKSNDFKTKFKEQLNESKSLLGTYESILMNYNNVVELYLQYQKENFYLYKQYKTDTNDTLTNERKTYYEDQNISSLNNVYKYVLLIIYCIVVICYIIFFIMYPSQMSWKIRLLLLLFFIALPFVSTFLLGKIIQLIYWIFGLLPKNVYL